jgi:hypothetical protein
VPRVRLELGRGCSAAPLDDAAWGPAARGSESDQMSTPARSSLLREVGPAMDVVHERCCGLDIVTVNDRQLCAARRPPPEELSSL